MKIVLTVQFKSKHSNYSIHFTRRETALICAARTGQLDCVRHLLNYGADTETRDGEGHTALWCAVREQREEVVTYLIHRRVEQMTVQIMIKMINVVGARGYTTRITTPPVPCNLPAKHPCSR